MKHVLPLLALLAMLLGAFDAGAATARIKDLTSLQGVRGNELFGYGLVVGLAGSGDTERVFFTSQSVSSMLGRLGIRIDPADVRSRNVAAVMVTARLPPFARPGTRIDVTVSSIGNARSLAGGVLLVTPLTGPDGQTYGLAQGPVQVGGYEASAAGSSLRKNHPTAGRVPSGGTVERAVVHDLADGPLVFQLADPDFATASRIAGAIGGVVGPEAARALDPAAVEVVVPDARRGDLVALVAELEALEVVADERARVAISERTGTVVAGRNVRIRPVVISHGGLRVSIGSTPVISQPAPFSDGGRTVRDRMAAIEAEELGIGVQALPAASNVDELVQALGLLGVGPRDLIAILQAMKAAGALDAEIEVL
ncbi:flagellar basal body P-ring protein FlgI [Vulgatibacter sp.]|uniref:flagellar basal body P-ring protein FlgI n=1 Tax=Vulgatibacter sp. TaxID=1971226 RepID=UPI003562A386